MTARTLLFWLDFEATGLNPREDLLLEYAVVITDLNLKELYSSSSIIPQPMGWVDQFISEKAHEMHIKNGLLNELRLANDTNCLKGREAVLRIENALIDVLKSFLKEGPTIFVIAGSSVWYDRAALKQHMPRLESMLHYRLLDTSVYKVGFPEIFGAKTSIAHRSMADIRESIRKQQLMRELLMGRIQLIQSCLQLIDCASSYETDDEQQVIEINELDFAEFERTVHRVQR